MNFQGRGGLLKIKRKNVNFQGGHGKIDSISRRINFEKIDILNMWDLKCLPFFLQIFLIQFFI